MTVKLVRSFKARQNYEAKFTRLADMRLSEQLREQIKFKVEKNFEGAVPFGLVEMLRVKSLRLAVEANGTAAEMVSACLMI